MKPRSAVPSRRLRFRHGDLVTTTIRSGREPRQRRTWVALNVTKADIHKGVQVSTPGVHLFTGYWYSEHPWNVHSTVQLPRRVLRGPRTPAAFGKVQDLNPLNLIVRPIPGVPGIKRGGRVAADYRHINVGGYVAKKHCKF